MSDSKNSSTMSAQPVIVRDTIDKLSESLCDQVEVLASELRSRWRSGQRVVVEQLGGAYPSVAKHEEQLLDLIYHEVLLREEFGEQPKLEDFTARFPQLAERLHRLFAVHGAIEEDNWDDELGSALTDEDSATDRGESNDNDAPSTTECDGSELRRQAHAPRNRRNLRPVEPPPGYELLEEIGRGGMAVVYRARQHALNRIVALKMLLAGGSASQEVLARIQQEAQAVARLQHPGIVQIHEVGEHRGLPFLSLEYVAGGTLHDWLGGRPLPPLEAARLIEQLARTAQYAHERGVVHRDLKPANVLLNQRPPSPLSSTTIPIHQTPQAEPSESSLFQAKISDFGLARILGSRSELTATGQVIGTPSYMAPEQAIGICDDVSPVQDIYSLGAILYELLVGRPPFRGATLFDTLEQVRSSEPVSPRQLQPQVPRDLETICLKCLEKTPDRRYSSALKLAEDLQRFREGKSITARPTGVLERSWKWARRFPAVTSLALLAMLLTIVGVLGIMREARRATESERLAKNDQARANALRVIADRERDNANTQRRNAEAALAKAAEQQELAESNLEQAFKTINTYASVGYSLRHEPGMQAVSKRLLDSTLQLYEDTAKKQLDTSVNRRRRIIALTAAGDLYRALRQHEQGEKLLTQAAQILESEFQEDSEDDALLHQATVVYWALGVLYNETNRPLEAIAAFRRDQAVHETLLKKNPNDINRRISLANLFTQICEAQKALGQPEIALENYESAISAMRDLLRDSPDNHLAMRELGLALHESSKLHYSMNRKETAMAAHVEAFDIRKQLFQQVGMWPENRAFLARSHASQGFYDRLDGNHESSVAQYNVAAELLRPLLEKYPDVYECHRQLIKVMIPQLISHMAANDPKFGRPLFEQISVRLTIAVMKFPQDKTMLELSSIWQKRWAEFLWEEGQKQYSEFVTKQAIAVSLTALNVFPKPTETDEARFSNNAAWQLTVPVVPSLRDLEKAVALARRAVELAPDEATNWQTLGAALYYSENFVAGRDALLRSIEIDPETRSKNSLIQLVQTSLARSKDTTFSARKTLSESHELTSPSPDLLAVRCGLLAMTLWKLDDKETARKVLDLVVDPPQSFSSTGSETRRLIAEARALITPQVEP